ncbi:MAG TPA: glycosyltransferase family 4 protein, partial [Abditibacteriaceae bacterium]
ELTRYLHCPVVTHVHELEYALNLMGAGLASVLVRSSHYIAASCAVRDNLVAYHSVAPEKIEVIHECIETQHSLDVASARKQTRAALGLPPNAFLVGGAGPLEWRKGTDLFVQLAQHLAGNKDEIPLYFLWVGGDLKSRYATEVRYDLAKWGLGERVHFVGEVVNPLDYFAALDVFALTSREDPFPLVCLEAASLSVPIVAFANAGGMPEFIEDDCGCVVPYADTYAMADAISELAKNPKKQMQLGTRAQQKVRERHDIRVTAPQIKSLLERLMKP